jgi:trimethylamine:corrinoid methyltransferase-like protein
VIDRTSPKQWIENELRTALDHATQKTHTILQSHYPTHISDAIDQQLREQFPIKLPRHIMQAR